jgi:hypothetical protein
MLIAEIILTETNRALLRYLTNKPLSPDYEGSDWFHEIWPVFVQQYLRPREQQSLVQYFDKPIEEMSFYDYYYLSPQMQRLFAEFMQDHGYDRDMLHDDPHNAPAWMQVSPNQTTLLPKTTWLVHFTDHADEIAQQGFTQGVENLDQLHLTRLGDAFGNVERRTSEQPGYNFGYQVGQTDLDHRVGGYGANAVMFQGRGVPVYHAGDREDQVIFYGPYVPRTRIIVLRHVGQVWQAERARQVLCQYRSLNQVTQWIAGHLPA